MGTLVNKVLKNNNPEFFRLLGRILIIQLVFQILYTSLILLYPPPVELDPIRYIQNSSYFLIFIIITVSIKHTIANRILVVFFAIEFFYLTLSALATLYVNKYYNLQEIILASILLLITVYLFFYSISPNSKKSLRHLVLGIMLTATIIGLIYSNVNILTDYSKLDYNKYWQILKTLNLNSYYLYLICLSFLLFIWYTYNQGHYLLSEFLPAVLSMHTLIIINEVYQLYNYHHLIDNFIDGQYFNIVISIGLILIWLIRLNYLSKPESIKNEEFILNYDLLSGFVEKPHNNFWDLILVKLGKLKLFLGTLVLFAIICIPIVFIGEINFFSRYNIILMLFFLVGVMIYAIIYTQRKWYNHIGFLIKRQRSNVK